MLTLRELAELVAKLRKAQKRWSRTRSEASKAEAKAMARKVDEAVDRVLSSFSSMTGQED
jgi:phage shock protein A